jgi:GT2 family glycosyltransferase
LFDSRYFLYYEEVDWCFAAKTAGWEIHYFPDTSVVHIGGESAASDGEITHSGRQLEALQIESELLYFRKNHGFGAVLVDVLLQTIADVIIPLKHTLKARTKTGWRLHLAHAKQYWLLSMQTRLGSKPTR